MAIGTQKIEDHLPIVKYNEGIYTALDVTTTGNTSTANLTASGTLAVTGVATFTAAPSFTAAPTGASPRRTTVSSALVGATVALTAAQCGYTFINRSTSGSPSWTLPTGVDGLWYTFYTANTTAGFTVTGGTIFARANATGASVTGTTLTNTQATAVVGDTITLVYDSTSSSWKGVAQCGIFAAA